MEKNVRGGWTRKLQRNLLKQDKGKDEERMEENIGWTRKTRRNLLK